MISDPIIIRDKITFKTTEVGGRKTGVKSVYRPNHEFDRLNNIKLLTAYIGEIVFENKEYMQLGETKFVTVRFLKDPKVEKYMEVGQKC